MDKEAKGFEDEEGDRHKVVPATETQPSPTAYGPQRVRNAPKSTAGTFKLLATAPHHAIVSIS